MSKQAIDSFVLKIFIALVIFDAVSVLYLTPKQKTPPVEAPTITTPPADAAAEEKEDQTSDSIPPASDFYANDEDDSFFNFDSDPAGAATEKKEDQTSGQIPTASEFYANDEDNAFFTFDSGDDKNNKNNENVGGLLVIQSCFTHEAHLKQIKAYLTAEYPSVIVETINYPLPPVKALLSKFQKQIHITMAGLFILGSIIFGLIGVASPAWYPPIKKNKNLIMAVAMGFSVILLEFSAKTGAFEVFFDGKLVFSTLQKGILPTTQNFDEILLK